MGAVGRNGQRGRRGLAKDGVRCGDLPWSDGNHHEGADEDRYCGEKSRASVEASAASGNVCALDEFAECSVVCVAVAPDDVAADHRCLFTMRGVVGAVEGEVAQRLELGFDPVQP